MDINKLKESFPILYQVHDFMQMVERLGYGQVEFVITAHNYEAKTIEMKAVTPDKPELATSLTKKVIIAKPKQSD